MSDALGIPGSDLVQNIILLPVWNCVGKHLVINCTRSPIQLVP